MAKRIKLKLSRVIPSFQICRLKDKSSVEIPKPLSSYKLSPFNPRGLDISFPSLPSPPPSTPNYNPSIKQKLVPVKGIVSKADSTITGCSSSEFYTDDDDSESLLFNSRSFSYESSQEFDVKSIQRHRRSLDGIMVKETASPLRKSVLRRMASCVMEGKVKESVAVVKKSEHPYEDFKRSMLEMILEKQIFESKDLEELLRCFLSLNSRQYHGVIVQAFSEIWELLFGD